MSSKSRAALFSKGPELSRLARKTELESTSQTQDYKLNTIFDYKPIYAPGIPFSKQLQRNLFNKTQSSKEIISSRLNNMISNIEQPNETFIKKRVHGVIPLSKQLARQGSLVPHFVQDYRLNYDLVFPKVQTRVHYAKEIRTKHNKVRSRKPLIFPMSIGPPRNNSFLL